MQRLPFFISPQVPGFKLRNGPVKFNHKMHRILLCGLLAPYIGRFLLAESLDGMLVHFFKRGLLQEVGILGRDKEIDEHAGALPVLRKGIALKAATGGR